MPIYIYEVQDENGEGEVFEVLQRMGEPALTHHPVTGAPVRQIITAPNLVLRHSSRADAQIMSDANLKRTGFTRYEKSGDGSTYVRTGGDKGPETFKKPT